MQICKNSLVVLFFELIFQICKTRLSRDGDWSDMEGVVSTCVGGVECGPVLKKNHRLVVNVNTTETILGDNLSKTGTSRDHPING